MGELDRRTRTFLDVTVVVWCALWLVIGYEVNREVLGLRKLSSTVIVAGRALDRTASQLRSFGDLPFVGEDVTRTAKEVHRAAVSAKFSGRQSRGDVAGLAHWLWFAISAIAILPILLVYGLIRFPVVRKL